MKYISISNDKTLEHYQSLGLYGFDSWGERLLKAMESHNEKDAEIVAMTCSVEFLDTNFYVGPKYCNCSDVFGKPFTVWTERRVYFPSGYDSSYWVSSVPRNPCDEATRIVGGGV